MEKKPLKKPTKIVVDKKATEENEIEIIDKLELKKGNIITTRDGKGNIKSVIEMDNKIVPISSRIVSLMKSRM